MEKINNILMVGVGGQGIILASNILSLTAMKAGYDIKKSEIHGMSQRGGSVFSHIRYGNEIHSPVIPKGKADILFALEALEVLRWREYTTPDTQIIYLQNYLKPSMVKEYPAGVDAEIKRIFNNVISIDPKVIKEQTGNVKVQNVALIGTLSKYTNLSEANYLAAIKELVPPHTFETNKLAFELGKNINEEAV